MSRKRKHNRSPDSHGPGQQAGPSRSARATPCLETKLQGRWAAPAVCVFLLLAVALVFGRTVQHGFLNFDDQQYVCDNVHVSQGLTKEAVAWSFTTRRAANWHPLTWLSHALDCQLYGVDQPAGHHLTNVVLHAAVAILLFLVLWRMTGRLWPSAFVAALFAVHPLRVESVAWVAERKDLLSGLFFMLTLAAYLGYVRHPSSPARYLLLLLVFVLGLMAKPMLVTVPFVLLLLDYWPLGRMARSAATGGTAGLSSSADSVAESSGAGNTAGQASSATRQTGFAAAVWRRLVIEKIPLLLLAAGSCAVTVVAQSGAIQTLEVIRLPVRIANALVSYISYLWQFFCPMDLAVFYPHPGVRLPMWQAAAALLVLAAVSVAVLLGRRRCPYLPVGWLWYLGMMAPVIGLVQVGVQAMADRYTYLPQIGLCIALAWGAADLAAAWSVRRWLLPVASSLIVVILMSYAWRQAGYWRDNESLWRHTIDCTSNNVVAHNNLGTALAGREQFDEAIEQYCIALDMAPNYTFAHNNLGSALDRCGQTDEAITHLRQALEEDPNYTEAHINLGIALSRCGLVDEAVEQLNEALRIAPDNAAARYNLEQVQPIRDAIVQAINARRNLLRSRPDDVALLDEVASILATNPNRSLRNGAEAVELAERAVRLSGAGRPAVLGTLAAAYAETGQFAKAVETAQRAIDLASAKKETAIVNTLQARIKLYRAGSPYHETRQAAGRN
jgi:protein O-mannosyl-transferase